jgi:hypothetical protein
MGIKRITRKLAVITALVLPLVVSADPIVIENQQGGQWELYLDNFFSTDFPDESGLGIKAHNGSPLSMLLRDSERFEYDHGYGNGDLRWQDVGGNGGVASGNRRARGFVTSGPPVSVPEPGTLALFGIGLAAMSLSRRRKKI